MIATLLLAFNFTASATELLKIPTDSKATYTVIEKSGSKNEPVLLTRREGPSGVSFAKRIFNCKNQTTKYLGTGDTLEELKSSKPDPKMGPIVEHSIAWYSFKFASK